MSNKIKLLLMFMLMATAFLVAGCASSCIDLYASDSYASDSYAIELDAAAIEEPVVLSEIIVPAATAGYEPVTEEEPTISASLASLHFADLDELLAAIGKAKFSEFAVSAITAFNVPANADAGDFDVLQAITDLYRPRSVRQGFEAAGITVRDYGVITFHHESAADERANFIWARTIPAENATTDFFGRGAIAEFYVERNGITYAITQWVTPDTFEPAGWVVAWAQNGQTFIASLPESYTEEDVLAFCDAQTISSWQLCGDAVSVSVQGMENVRIFENTGGIAAFGGAGNEIIAIGNGLYRTGAVGFADGASGDMERVGYRWLIDEATQRYQYVLQPGAFEFRADGVTGEPGLLVRHFQSGDVANATDFTDLLAENIVSEFSVTVNAENVVDFEIDGEPVQPPPAPTHIVIENWSANTGWLTIWCNCCCNTLQLSATVYPLGANQNVVWSSGHDFLSVDQTGFVTVDGCCCWICSWCCFTCRCCSTFWCGDISSNIPITATAENGVAGTFYVGIVPFHALDEDYQVGDASYFDFYAGQVRISGDPASTSRTNWRNMIYR